MANDNFSSADKAELELGFLRAEVSVLAERLRELGSDIPLFTEDRINAGTRKDLMHWKMELTMLLRTISAGRR